MHTKLHHYIKGREWPNFKIRVRKRKITKPHHVFSLPFCYNVLQCTKIKENYRKDRRKKLEKRPKANLKLPC
jgi:hypothetical protein